MNLLLRQRLKDLATELQEVEYNYKLSSEKISMQETYIKDIKNNAGVITAMLRECKINFSDLSEELEKIARDVFYS